MWLDRLTDGTTADSWEGTPSNPEGPYYVPGAPLLKPVGPGASYVLPMRSDEPGTPLIVSGQVRALDGQPLAMAELDTWQCADTGVYSMLGMDDQPDWNLRGRFHTDEEGRFEFRTIKPVPYMPADIPQSILDFYDALGKAHFRPRHIHLKVRHEDIAASGQFMTQLYFQGDPYLEADPGQNAHTRLAMPTRIHHEPAGAESRRAAEPRLLSGRPFQPHHRHRDSRPGAAGRLRLSPRLDGLTAVQHTSNSRREDSGRFQGHRSR
ncbi:dioxygenase family protein [Streptomyces spongiae]|uniref:Intradiol ring-cleavage dioxygenases domain-containing protein n=1 Tax=Streptomyces spongiae TaxID=565072 RepID=A0A5N8XU14_9ACTN|nr:hypothetical protein [Streptomyces spongiae]MPY62115.1 hypothetical protein [Streptomyces spongiae]